MRVLVVAMKLISRDPKKRPRDEDDLLELARVADVRTRARLQRDRIFQHSGIRL